MSRVKLETSDVGSKYISSNFATHEIEITFSFLFSFFKSTQSHAAPNSLLFPFLALICQLDWLYNCNFYVRTGMHIERKFYRFCSPIIKPETNIIFPTNSIKQREESWTLPIIVRRSRLWNTNEREIKSKLRCISILDVSLEKGEKPKKQSKVKVPIK